MKAKVIILEGPDGAGKTTLANKLVANGYHYVHHGLYDDNPNQLFARYVRSIWKATRSKHSTVIDRCYLSEMVYGEVMRGVDRLGPMRRKLLHRLCQGLGVLEVTCLPPWETVLQNWREKKNDYTSDAKRLHDIYLLYVCSTGYGCYHRYDYTRGEFRSPSVSPLPSGVIGSSFAKILIVGEQPNKRKATVDLPFFAVTGSSGYLNEAIRLAGLREYDIALTNAVPLKHQVSTSGWRAASGARNLRTVMKSLPYFEHAIALGIVAARECKRQGIPHVTVPHPSYWKRFHSKRSSDYISMIREASHDESQKLQYIHGLAGTALVGDDEGRGVGSSRQEDQRTVGHPARRRRSNPEHYLRPGEGFELQVHDRGVVVDTRGKKRRRDGGEVQQTDRRLLG